MVEWAAANLSSSSFDNSSEDEKIIKSDEIKKRRRIISSETPEAAIARLTTAYNAAMEAVRALHKASNKIVKDRKKKKKSKIQKDNQGNNKDDDDDDVTMLDANHDNSKKIESLKRGALAARNAFENALLSDPLIVTYAPSFTKTMLKIKLKKEESKYIPSSAAILSDAHKITVKQLTYLTLMNYADLILSCIVQNPKNEQNYDDQDILDRGVVRVLDIILSSPTSSPTSTRNINKKYSCWDDFENEEESKRLALVSYCDAVDIDGSDPTTWIKLACCARSVGRVIQQKSIHGSGYNDRNELIMNQRIDTLSHHRLERFALERGLTVLKPGIPCNRLIARAFQQFEQKMFSDDNRLYDVINQKGKGDDDDNYGTNDTCVLNLRRDDWSTLGRLLLETYKSDQTSIVRLHLSPMLTLDTSTLGLICEFLGLYNSEGNSDVSDEVKNLEATCQALSVDILSARRKTEQSRKNLMKQIGKCMHDENLENDNKNDKNNNMDVAREVQGGEIAATQDDEKNLRVKQRTSTRVQSQLISSGKQAERSARRNSVEYCIVSAVIPCTTDHPLYSLLTKEDFKWESLALLSSKAEMTKNALHVLEKNAISTNKIPAKLTSSSKTQASNNIVSKSSVISFISRWGKAGAVSYEMLHNFLAHVSCFIGYVFNHDKDFTLISCVTECYELLVDASSSTSKSLVSCWYGELEFASNKNRSITLAIETLAINLLYAELQMRASELHGNDYLTNFTDKVDKVKWMIPYLLEYSSSLSKCGIPLKHRCLVSNLQVRIQWLVGIFYVFWSKHSSKITDEKEAEIQAMKHIDNAISYLKELHIGNDHTIATPHLLSPGRLGDHWNELSIANLQSFRDELEANTVLSRCRQKFFDQIAEWKHSGSTSTADLTTEQKYKMKSISSELFKRYHLGGKNVKIGENHDELIDDFIINNASNLAPILENDEAKFQRMWPDVWDSIPVNDDPIVFDDLSNASYLTMMSLALLYGDESLSLVSFLGSLLLSVLKMHSIILTKITINEVENRKEEESGSDSKADLLVEDASDDFAEHREKMSALTNLAHLLLSKLWKMTQIAVAEGFLKEMIQSIDLILIFQHLIQLSTGYSSYPSDGSKDRRILTTIPADLNLLKSTFDFAAYIKTLIFAEDLRQKLDSSIFVELCKIFVHEKEVMSAFLSKPDKNVNRYEFEKRGIKRSKFTSLVATELSGLLLSNPHTYGKACVMQSFLIESLMQGNDQIPFNTNITLCPLLKVIETLTWFWTMVSTRKSKMSDCLRTPIAAAIISLLGSSGHANSSTILTAFSQLKMDNVLIGGSLDYFDSDDSANGILDNQFTENDGVEAPYSYRALLHALCRCVQCIGLVFSACEDSEISCSTTIHFSQSYTGNFLPLVVVRVLGGIADFVLNEFSDINTEDRVWSEHYPYGFRGAGAQLDAILYKAYRCLHGITLSAQNSHLSTSRDYAVPSVAQTSGSSSTKNNIVPPESIQASARLYRCIMRAYAGGRRTIPQDALECVLSAIPNTEESASLKDIKKFLFQTQQSTLLDNEVDTSNALESIAVNMDAIALQMPECMKNAQQISPDFNMNNDVLKLRNGVCKIFAEGPLPSLGSSILPQKSDESKVVKEREIASDTEKAVHKKLMYIIEALQYEPYDAAKWYRAGLCLEAKINIIMDRLQQPLQCYNSNDFYVKKFRSRKHREESFRITDNESLPLDELIEQQYSEYKKHFISEEYLFSDDLSFYLEHQWSSFSSVKEMSFSVGKQLRHDENMREFSQWSLIQSKFDEGNFAEWQCLWGKKFLVALHTMRERCFKAALYLSTKHDISKKGSLHPEIAESLGTMYYSDIPSKSTLFEVRQRAKVAQSFFERAMTSILQSGDDDLAEYELQVMIGKCQEKIAKTLQSEAFTGTHPRKYEILMEKALESYDKALEAAKKYEEENGALESQGGGSNHGIVEMIYRLHASRLKLLLRAVRKSKNERNMAEIEALKLTEVYWHEQSNDTNVERKVEDVRERIWAVLSDVVECMVYCRTEQPFFHRSVYRHAQALLWAPLFHDPDGFIKEGSQAMVPAYKSYKLRGLSSGPCAASTEAILNSLFDKKRPQLCAIWVTTPLSPSPFEYLNDSSRKFDRLRWKYIGAFVDCMRLCGRRSILEIFIKWCYHSNRDLPSFYIATAMQEGDSPQNSHEIENMLLTKEHGLIYFAIQYANRAIADIIRKESITLPRKKLSDDDWNKNVNELLADAYKCFLRLNCSIDESCWQVKRVKEKMSNCQILECEALCIAYMTLKKIRPTSLSNILRHSPWDNKFLLLQSAVKDCEKMFPAIALKATSLSQKKKRKQKDQGTKESIKKQKDEESTIPRKVVVNVPKNVKTDEKFIVEVCCEYFCQRVQLVCSGSKRIMFDLDLPKNITSELNIKHIS